MASRSTIRMRHCLTPAFCRLENGASCAWSEEFVVDSCASAGPGPNGIKKRIAWQIRPEASTGFEPVMRVLQTLALPLGHDAVANCRAGDGIRTHDLLLGKETFYH